MSFLTPIQALVAAAILVPLVILLYFLKLRRRTIQIPSTLLWESALRDLQANTPFQRLRVSLLLILQLAALLFLLAALSRPMWGSTGGSALQTIIMVDVSASMAARLHAASPDPTRLDVARRIAREIVQSVVGSTGTRSLFGLGAPSGSCMIVDFASYPRILASMTSNRAALLHAVDSLEVREEEATLARALGLIESAIENGDSAARTRIVIITDSAAMRDEELSLRGQRPEVIRVADDDAEERNIGITTLSARWVEGSIDSEIDLLVALTSTLADPQLVALRVEADGRPVESGTVSVPGLSSPASQSALPIVGQAARTFRFPAREGTMIRVTQSVPDAFTLDDSAALRLRPRDPGRLLLVAPEGEPDPFLLRALQVIAGENSVTTLSDSNFAGMLGLTPEETRLRFEPFAATVFDRVSVSFVPPLGTLWIASVPPVEGLALGPPEAMSPGSLSRRVMSWDRAHPLTANLALDTLAVADDRRWTLPPRARSLVLGDGGSLIALLDSGLSTIPSPEDPRAILVSFPVEKSNWPLHASFVIFLKNAVDVLTRSGAVDSGLWYRADESRVARLRPGESTAPVIEGPGGARSLVPRPDGSVVIPPLSRVGIYTSNSLAPPDDRFAVNVLSVLESDIRPRGFPVINRLPVIARSSQESSVREVWPWALVAGLVLLCVEWMYYLRRVRG